MKYLLFNEEANYCEVYDSIVEMKNECSENGVLYAHEQFYFEVQEDFVIPVDNILGNLYESILDMRYKKIYL